MRRLLLALILAACGSERGPEDFPDAKVPSPLVPTQHNVSQWADLWDGSTWIAALSPASGPHTSESLRLGLSIWDSTSVYN